MQFSAQASGGKMIQQKSSSSILHQNAAVWHKSAPEKIRRACREDDPAIGWTRWRDHLAKRKSPVPPSELWPGKADLLLAASAGLGVDGETKGLLASLRRPDKSEPCWGEKVETWIEGILSGPVDPRRALEAVAWAHALPEAAARLDCEAWWKLLDHLCGLARDASEMPLDGQPLVQQLLGGELSLTLAFLLPEIVPCRKGAKAGRKILSEGITELIDGEGLPNCQILDAFRPLMACWTRCRVLGRHLEKGSTNTKAGYQYEWAVRAALRLCRPDGGQVFSQSGDEGDDLDWIAAALACGGDEDDESIASLALPGRARLKGLDETLLPSPADHSAWACLAVMQPAWGLSEPKLALAYEGQDFRMELSHQGELLLDGTWTPEIRLGEKVLQPEGDWQVLCWVSDDDVDYLELEMQLKGGTRIQRHVAMAREDRFLFLADAILDCPGDTVQYCGRFSLANEAGLAPAEESHEAFLMGEKAAALVLPLALPEWRVESSPGQFVATSDTMELQLSGQGGMLFAPLFFDLKPRRTTRPATWRRLTVAERLEIVPPSVAAGYRVMVGKNQWLIYRSLAPAANRTLLGHNLATEMLIARFDTKGEVEPLIEMEGE